ncbi:MAG: serine/threonine protein kinase [Myxococcales bacterium]|nr:serine/threonine protein kinase [Myxococcales bacterium]
MATPLAASQRNAPFSGRVIGTRRTKAAVQLVNEGHVVLISVSGLIDEHFTGFDRIETGATIAAINLSGMTGMTSFGGRQWSRAVERLPTSIAELYLVGCPTVFVDQLNMVLNFGGAGKVLSAVAPYLCITCGVESLEMIDVLQERVTLAKGSAPEKRCGYCRGALEFSEIPASYFAFVDRYGASSLPPELAQLLASTNLYTGHATVLEKPPRIIKLIHGSVTYFRIIGTIGSMFRARPLLVGIEGEVVIDLAKVERFDAAGQREWRHLLKQLAAEVPTITLVDVSPLFLTNAEDSFGSASNICVASVLVPYCCINCDRKSYESKTLDQTTWPLAFSEQVCSACSGTSRSQIPAELLTPLENISARTPPESAKLIRNRVEVLSRAVTDAHVAEAGEGAAANPTADDTIGRYKIIRRLSAGGMADVFLAKQIGIGGFEKPVALKKIHRKLLESRRMAIELFLNEAKISSRLLHPNIVQVFDVGEVEGVLYLAMEYVRGKDLREVTTKLRQSRTTMPLGDACFIVCEIAKALDYAYWAMDLNGERHAVVHRDVSPHNIILSYDGAVKLLDFGVATSAATEQPEAMIVGKWMYMSPEQTADKPTDHRSDLFSLGVILYLLCTGDMPFTGRDPKEIVGKIRTGQFKPLKEAAPDVPESLGVLVGRLLSPKPEDRPQRGQEVVVELTDMMRHLAIDNSSERISKYLAALFANAVTGSSAANDRTASSLSRAATPEDALPTTITPRLIGIPKRPPEASVSISVSEFAEVIPKHAPPIPEVPLAAEELAPVLRESTAVAILKIAVTVIMLLVLGVAAYLLLGSG